ncbi:MAG: alpha-L-fucosidase [Chloroflexi bacterium]|nr:alpha-L-fucosidase [Chloroflexota bacterium]
MVVVEDTSRALYQASPAGLQAFRAMRLGLSVHWGLYALLGRGEWVMYQERIPTHQYERLAQRFDPVRFDAEAWADTMDAMGAKGFAITSKHHDGFCMFDSALTDYKITNAPFGRDVIGELAEACHRHGIALHFYYSLLDWHARDYVTYWKAYVAYYQNQLRELCTKYGPIGGILFDGYWPRNTFTPENAWFQPAGDWDLAGTYDLIHQLQPDAVVVNNHHVLPLKGEDYQIWELDMPGENRMGFNTTEVGAGPYATWMNVNKGWAWYTEQDVKPAALLIDYVRDSNARGATCWLNVGPTPLGEILPEEQDRLREVGAWMRSQR